MDRRSLLIPGLLFIGLILYAPYSAHAAPGRIVFGEPGRAAAQAVGPAPEILVEVAQVTPDGHRPVFASTVRGRPSDVEVDPGVYDVFAQHSHSGIIVRLNAAPIVLADGEAGQVASPESVNFRAIARDRHSLWQAKVEAQFAERPDASHVEGDVLVRFHAGTPLAVVTDLVGAVGGTIVSRIPQIHVYTVDVTGLPILRVIRALAGHPDIEFAEPNGVHQLTDVIPQDTYYASKQLSYLEEIRLQDAWAAFDLNGDTALSSGEFPADGIVIAVVDTGVDWGHPDLSGSIWTNSAEYNGVPDVDDDDNGKVDDYRGWDFHLGINDPLDLQGHGTHVAGIAAAITDNDVGIAGVSWRGQIMALKISDGATKSMSVSAESAAIIYAANHGADVINMSFGGGISATEAAAITYAADRQVILVAASGNENAATALYPAR
ncbi:MAG: S8 family serine peptidase, partial [Candidatus Poribacteria bacterium]